MELMDETMATNITGFQLNVQVDEAEEESRQKKLGISGPFVKWQKLNFYPLRGRLRKASAPADYGQFN